MIILFAGRIRCMEAGPGTSYLYVLVLYGTFFGCFIVGALIRDARERMKKKIYLTADDVRSWMGGCTQATVLVLPSRSR
jgi:hypothetical protein